MNPVFLTPIGLCALGEVRFRLAAPALEAAKAETDAYIRKVEDDRARAESPLPVIEPTRTPTPRAAPTQPEHREPSTCAEWFADPEHESTYRRVVIDAARLSRLPDGAKACMVSELHLFGVVSEVEHRCQIGETLSEARTAAIQAQTRACLAADRLERGDYGPHCDPTAPQGSAAGCEGNK